MSRSTCPRPVAGGVPRRNRATALVRRRPRQPLVTGQVWPRIHTLHGHRISRRPVIHGAGVARRADRQAGRGCLDDRPRCVARAGRGGHQVLGPNRRQPPGARLGEAQGQERCAPGEDGDPAGACVRWRGRRHRRGRGVARGRSRQRRLPPRAARARCRRRQVRLLPGPARGHRQEVLPDLPRQAGGAQARPHRRRALPVWRRASRRAGHVRRLRGPFGRPRTAYRRRGPPRRPVRRNERSTPVRRPGLAGPRAVR